MSRLMLAAAFPAAEWLKSPPAVVAGILLALAVVYWVLTKTLTEGIGPGDRESRGSGEPGAGEETGIGDEDWDRDQYSYHPTGPAYGIESMVIGGARASVGDTASQVVRLFSDGRGDCLPTVERAWPGRASRVLRTYALAGATVTFEFERDCPDDPLTVRSISLHTVA